MNEKQRLELAEWALKYVVKSGATEAAVELDSERRVDVEFRDGKLDTLAEAQQNRLRLEIYVDQRFSTNSTSDLRKEELAKFIDEAVASTRYLAKDEYRGLPNPAYYPEGSGGDLKIFDSAYGHVETKDRVKLAREIQAAAKEGSDKIVSATGSCSDSHYEMVRVHSNGFMGGVRGTRFDASAEVTVQDESGSRPDDYCSATTRFRSDLPLAEALGREAAERALTKLGQRKIASGQYACLIENRAGRRLLRILQEPLSGRGLQQKSSFLDGLMHQQVGSSLLTMIDDPGIEKGLASRYFDDEGLAAKRLPIFENGVLQNYYVDVYYGKKLGMAPTTGSPSNVVFADGSKSLQEMIKGVKQGILVQGFIGGNSNSTTGDFSMGVSGRVIENGGLTVPVHEMNIAGNARDFLGRLVEVGNDAYIYSALRSPSLLFDGIHFSGV